jgi:hypothetical protein
LRRPAAKRASSRVRRLAPVLGGLQESETVSSAIGLSAQASKPDVDLPLP